MADEPTKNEMHMLKLQHGFAETSNTYAALEQKI